MVTMRTGKVGLVATHWLAGGLCVKERSSFQNCSPAATVSLPTNRSSSGFSLTLARLVDTVTPMPTTDYINVPERSGAAS